jgi:hypothetical protein
MWVGLPTVYTIVGEKVASGVMDRYLGRTNEQAQQADKPIDPSTRADNLFEPPPGDPGPHGIFGEQAHARSPQLWLTMHKRALLGGGAAIAGLAATLAVMRAP